MTHSIPDARGTGAWRRALLRHAALFAAVCTFGVGSRLQAQQEYLYTATYRDADIRTVAEQVQRVIGRPIVLDSRVRAQVTILSNAPMTADAFYRAFLAALEVHGFVARESGNAILIVPREENRE